MDSSPQFYVKKKKDLVVFGRKISQNFVAFSEYMNLMTKKNSSFLDEKWQNRE